MNKRQSKILTMMVVVGLAVMFVGASPASAADGDGVAGSTGLGLVGMGIGAGLVIIGASLGIGRIGGSALESMARQPEVAGQLTTPMLITAALIEGATFFALILIFLGINKL